MKYFRGLSYVFGTMAIYLGLPLLGWGIGGVRAFMAFAPRLGYAAVVVLFAVAVGWQGIDNPEGVEGRGGQEEKRVGRHTVMGYALTALLFAGLWLLPFDDRRSLDVLDLDQAVRWIDVPLCAIGYVLVFWSGLALGRQYSAEVTI
jgi:hypothetical protein